MDFGTLKRRVRQSASLTTSDDDDIEDFINDAVRDFCRDAEVGARPFVFTLVADQGVYDLADLAAALTPAAGGVIRFLTLFAGAAGERAAAVDIGSSLEELGSLQSGGLTPGRPTKAVVAGFDTLVMHPTPNDAYELSGWLVPMPATMTADVDVPAVPEQYHRAIYYRAVQLAIEWDRQGDAEAKEFEGRYMGQVGFARRARSRMSGGSKSLVPSSQMGGSSWPPYPFGSM